MVMTLDH